MIGRSSFREETKGQFCKRAVWRMCPLSGFWPTFFCASFYPFFPCTPHPSPQAIFLFWGQLWTGSPHRKKGKILFLARKNMVSWYRGTSACTLVPTRPKNIHKFFWRGGKVSRPGGQGSKFYVLSSEPKEHKYFCPESRPGRPVTGAAGKSFMCKSFMCLFCSLTNGKSHFSQLVFAVKTIEKGPLLRTLPQNPSQKP